jgi:hypothetical protein
MKGKNVCWIKKKSGCKFFLPLFYGESDYLGKKNFFFKIMFSFYFNRSVDNLK